MISDSSVHGHLATFISVSGKVWGMRDGRKPLTLGKTENRKGGLGGATDKINLHGNTPIDVFPPICPHFLNFQNLPNS